MKLYLLNVKKATGNLFNYFSAFLNALLGPPLNMLTKTENFGYYRNTLSASLGKTWPNCKACQWFCLLISVLGSDDNHCREASKYWKKQ